MEVKKLSLDDKAVHKKSIYEWMREEEQKNVVCDCGINWGTVYFLTDRQVEEFVEIYRRTFEAPRYSVEKHTGLCGMHLSHIMRIRSWLHWDEVPIGVKEKKHIIDIVERAIYEGEFTGISPSVYPEIIEKVIACEDVPDVEANYIHFHI